ncbi:MAG: hypothetical protein ACRDP3_22465 [Streptomyces sp.]|uniref:hypothetical protein n=1 Tax=Streptomyces sp. TaxID=1931 RepID=UPI003D6A365F
MTASTTGQGRPPHRPRHRVLTLVIVVLLIAIPSGYLVKSAIDSRESGEDKERKASSAGLAYGWPSKVQRRVYGVPVPPASSRVAFYETNSWRTSRLYVQFRTSPKRLGEFLEEAGTARSALRAGQVTINEKRAGKVGWDLDKEGHSYAGTTHRQPKGKPDLAITVDTTYKSRPRVYVVSTAKF